LREKFIAGAKAAIPDLIVNGSGEQLPGIINLTFPGTESDTLLLLFDAAGVACSTGSACSAGVHEPSHVLMAMGHSQVSAQSSLRFSLSYLNSESDVAEVISLFPSVIARARAANL
jgi:cysteine desulfurase